MSMAHCCYIAVFLNMLLCFHNTDTDNDHEDNVPLALNIVTLDMVFAFLLLSEVENNATRP